MTKTEEEENAVRVFTVVIEKKSQIYKNVVCLVGWEYDSAKSLGQIWIGAVSANAFSRHERVPPSLKLRNCCLGFAKYKWKNVCFTFT